MASIIDLPDFMFQRGERKYNKFLKIFYTFFGLIIGSIHKNTNGKIFCNLMNIFFNKDGKFFTNKICMEKIYGQVINSTFQIKESID